jgi:hypothetical protein
LALSLWCKNTVLVVYEPLAQQPTDIKLEFVSLSFILSFFASIPSLLAHTSDLGRLDM